MAKLNWLDEVREDAKFNYHQRLRDEKAKQEYEAGKAARTANVEEVVEPENPAPGTGETYEPKVDKKGK